jgi:hypothetical protein
MLYEQNMNEEAYRDRSGMDLWIGSDWIWHPELQMRSANVWDMTVIFDLIICVYFLDKTVLYHDFMFFASGSFFFSCFTSDFQSTFV